MQKTCRPSKEPESEDQKPKKEKKLLRYEKEKEVKKSSFTKKNAKDEPERRRHARMPRRTKSYLAPPHVKKGAIGKHRPLLKGERTHITRERSFDFTRQKRKRKVSRKGDLDSARIKKTASREERGHKTSRTKVTLHTKVMG